MPTSFLRLIKAILIFSVCIAGIWSLVGWLLPLGIIFKHFDVESWETVWIVADLFRPIITVVLAIPLSLWIWNRIVPAAIVHTQELGRASSTDVFSRQKRTIILTVIIVAYILTGALGVPSAQTKFTAHVIASHKELQVRQGSSASYDPRIRLLVGFPLLPGVVVCYNDYQIGGMNGWGGWEFYAWYPGHITQIWSCVRRLS